MKAIFKITLSLLILFNLSFSKEKIILANGEWPPFLSEHIPKNGFASHLVKEAFKAVDIEVEYVFLPWQRAYEGAKKGKYNDKVCNGTVVWVYTKNRAKYFEYSNLVFSADEVLFYKKTKPISHWDSLEDLKDLRIGGLKHTVYPSLEKASEDGILALEKLSGGYAWLFDRLLAHRIEATPQVKEVGLFLLNTNFSKEEQDKVGYSESIIERREYHVIFSKALEENKRYLKLFNEGLEIIKENGTFDRLNLLLENSYYNRYID